MILPVHELAAFPRCSVCEQLKAEKRSSARRSLRAPVLLDEFHWQCARSIRVLYILAQSLAAANEQ